VLVFVLCVFVSPVTSADNGGWFGTKHLAVWNIGRKMNSFEMQIKIRGQVARER
jgi:hypothetical protein